MWPDDDGNYEWYRAFIQAAETVSVIISGGEITLTGKQWLRFLELESETGSSDTVTKINGGNANEIVCMNPKTGHEITWQNNADLVIGADFVGDSPYDSLWVKCRSDSLFEQAARNSNG